MDNTPEGILRRLNEALRTGEKKSKAGAARAAGVTTPGAWEWFETGSIQRDRVYAVARYLGVNTDWLLTGEGPMARTQYGVDMNKLTAAISMLFEVAQEENFDLVHRDPERLANTMAYAYSIMSESDDPSGQRHALVVIRTALQQEVSRSGQDRIDERGAKGRDS